MSETPAEKAEASAIRRRWITIGEIVAVVGVVIAGLTLWSGWSDRKADQAEKQVEKAEQSKAASRVTLTATTEADGKRLALKDADRDITGIEVNFPRALGVTAQSALLDARIERDWFDKAVLAATDGGADAVEGKLPVVIAASWSDGDTPRTDRAIYDIVFRTEGHTFSGRSVTLRGILLRERVGGNATARLDTLWAVEAKRLKPTP